MSVKIMVVFLCAAIGTAGGYFVMCTYRRNFVYLDGVCKMIGELKRNIAYRRDGVASIIGTMSAESVQLKKNIAEYIDYAVGKVDAPQISRGFLPKETYERITELFRSIGRSDGSSQIDELNMYEDAFSKLREAAEIKYSKHGAVAVKLGFLLGLGVGILTL
ncbi:MAG: hypothetical protein J1G01_05030 [Clostridiales bacterium]|nr:hypothetical protein [Clostridiales bacterium]